MCSYISFFFKISGLRLEKKFSWKYTHVRLQDLHHLTLYSFSGIACGTGEALSRARRAFLAMQWTTISAAPCFNTVNNDRWTWTGKEAPELDLLCGSSLEDEIIWEGTVMLCQHQLTPRKPRIKGSPQDTLNHLSAANPCCEPLDWALHCWYLPLPSLGAFALFSGCGKAQSAILEPQNWRHHKKPSRAEHDMLLLLWWNQEIPSRLENYCVSWSVSF